MAQDPFLSALLALVLVHLGSWVGVFGVDLVGRRHRVGRWVWIPPVLAVLTGLFFAARLQIDMGGVPVFGYRAVTATLDALRLVGAVGSLGTSATLAALALARGLRCGEPTVRTGGTLWTVAGVLAGVLVLLTGPDTLFMLVFIVPFGSAVLVRTLVAVLRPGRRLASATRTLDGLTWCALAMVALHAGAGAANAWLRYAEGCAGWPLWPALQSAVGAMLLALAGRGSTVTTAGRRALAVLVLLPLALGWRFVVPGAPLAPAWEDVLGEPPGQCLPPFSGRVDQALAEGTGCCADSTCCADWRMVVSIPVDRGWRELEVTWFQDRVPVWAELTYDGSTYWVGDAGPYAWGPELHATLAMLKHPVQVVSSPWIGTEDLVRICGSAPSCYLLAPHPPARQADSCEDVGVCAAL